MSIFPNIELISEPGYAEALRQLTPAAVDGIDTLIVYEGDYDFLARVLNAAGYDDPKLQLHLLAWTAADGGLDLTGLIRYLKIERVILFGQDLSKHGLHFQVAKYFPVTVAGVTYMNCPPVSDISTAKANGNNGPAGALWGGIKAAFLRPDRQ